MNYPTTLHRTLGVIVFCLAASLSAFAEETPEIIETAEQRPVVIMDTFAVHARAKDFFKLIDKAIKLAQEADPEGGGEIYVLAGHPEPEFASEVTVFTTYPSMDAYIDNKEVLANSPKLQAIFEEMQAADFNFLRRSMNTVVGKY
ncbi:MAG: hypothetical protein KDI01_07585 [Halioglobus sp.]|nr:hypothetical protein [Halioglobus sp.]